MFADFDPITGLSGGALIGLAAAVLLLFNGDILGASGILSSILNNPVKALQDPSQYWKISLLASFLFTSTHLLGSSYVEAPQSTNAVPPSIYGLIVGGFLVGLGTKLGNGCTSGTLFQAYLE